jgi:hypothetical protein
MFFRDFLQVQQFATAWKAAMDQHMARVEQLSTELASIEQRAIERAVEAVDESAKLFKASLQYGLELSAAWRKQSIDATKQTLGG